MQWDDTRDRCRAGQKDSMIVALKTAQKAYSLQTSSYEQEI